MHIKKIVSSLTANILSAYVKKESGNRFLFYFITHIDKAIIYSNLKSLRLRYIISTVTVEFKYLGDILWRRESLYIISWTR